MSNNNSFFLEVLEKEKRSQIEQDLANAWHLHQLPEKESESIHPLESLLHLFKRFTIAIRLLHFASS